MINFAYLHRLRKSTIKYILVTGAIFCICFLHTNISYGFRILEIKLFGLSFILFEWCFCHYWSFTDPGYWLFSLHRNKHANSAKHCFLCLMKKVWVIWWLCITYFIMSGHIKVTTEPVQKCLIEKVVLRERKWNSPRLFIINFCKHKSIQITSDIHNNLSSYNQYHKCVIYNR